MPRRSEAEGREGAVAAGLGAEDAYWLPVVADVSRRTRACEYDRHEVSETAPYGALPREPRDARDQARELEQLLRNDDIETDAPGLVQAAVLAVVAACATAMRSRRAPRSRTSSRTGALDAAI